MLPKNYKYHKKMDKAIEYLAVSNSKTGRNTKPVVLHSIRVGIKLFDEGYSENIIIAGILHDIIEDTEANIEEIQLKFGSDVVQIIKATTFNSNILNKRLSYEEMFERCKIQGYEALIVKTADILDNSDYIELAHDYDTRKYLLEKTGYFLDISRDIIGKENVWIQLKEVYEKLKIGDKIMLKYEDKRGNKLIKIHKINESKSNEFSPLTHSLVIAEKENETLFVYNNWKKEWELPGGIKEEDETIRECAIREFAEETKICISDLDFIGIIEWQLGNEKRTEYGALYKTKINSEIVEVNTDEIKECIYWDLDKEIGNYAELDRTLVKLCQKSSNS